jgi:hypothetical protein
MIDLFESRKDSVQKLKLNAGNRPIRLGMKASNIAIQNPRNTVVKFEMKEEGIDRHCIRNQTEKNHNSREKRVGKDLGKVSTYKPSNIVSYCKRGHLNRSRIIEAQNFPNTSRVAR